jgi:hypothetical protein
MFAGELANRSPKLTSWIIERARSFVEHERTPMGDNQRPHKESKMTDPAAIADRYIALWNEIDPGRRRALLAEGWTENAAYVDPLAKGEGHDQISALIGAVQQRFPGFLFTLAGRADGYADRLRFSWALGPASEADMIKGTDFAVIEDGRLRSVTGFLDKVPAGA